MSSKKKRPCGRRRVRLRLDATRACGDCEACCYAMPIEALSSPESSPEFVPCGAQRSRHEPGCFGCTRYAERPEWCRRYRCEWIRGMVFHGISEASLRPDVAGLILHGWRSPVWGSLVVVSETVPHGFDRPIAGYILDSLQRDQLIMLRAPGVRKLAGPAARLQWAVERARVAVARHREDPAAAAVVREADGDST